MKIIDYRFPEKSITLLKSLIGQTLNDVVFYGLPNTATTTYGMASITVNDFRYCFSNFLESIEYINRTDDVSIFRFDKISDVKFNDFLEERVPIRNSINQKIKTIKVLNENQQLSLNGTLEFDIFTVRGVVISLQDGREISFEKSIWFSEFITIKNGYDLINSFSALDEFYEEWSDSQYTAQAKRDVLLIE
ncbi:MAG: hypothetical protein LUC25_00025 [Ruminococcus sp.]|nr:hypothetical protein [Ruminococcus sp.]